MASSGYSLYILSLTLLVLLFIVPFTSPAPQSWMPQGRFGKRAWRPSGRFGKRPSNSMLTSFIPGREDGPKRAWRPSSRFGKREDEEILDGLSSDEASTLMLKRAWKPQGRFGKRDGLDVPEELLAHQVEEEKRAWKPQGRFGKRLLRSQRWRSVIEALKRAWKPQGRFGKRGDQSMQDLADEIGVNSDDIVIDSATGEICVPFPTQDDEDAAGKQPSYKCFRATAEEEETEDNESEEALTNTV